MQFNRWVVTTAIMSIYGAGHYTLAAQDADTIKALRKQIEELDQKVRILERKDELDQEAAAEKAKTAPVVSIGGSGFIFRSADSNFIFRIRGNIQTDGRFFINDNSANNGNDTFLLRRVRPSFEGTWWDRFDFRIMPDFAPATHTLMDAYANVRLRPQFQVQAGKFKSPFSLERLVSQTDLLFVERGLPINLAPNRDVGAMLHGRLFDDSLDYAFGVFNGTPDGGSSVTDLDDDKELAGRIFAHPFRATSIAGLQDFGIGVAGTYGDQTLGAPGRYLTPGQQTFFTYRTGTTNSGTHWRVGPQAYHYWGPFGALAEYTISSQELTFGATEAKLNNHAWQVAISYVLTGENATYRGVVPAKPFSLANHTWGAFQLTARCGKLIVDGDTFPVFANPATAARRANSWGAGLNWYLNRNFKAVLNYDHTDFEGGNTGAVTGQDEHALFTRLQLNF